MPRATSRLLRRLVAQGEQLARLGQQMLAGGRQAHALAVALEQLGLQLFLQLFDGDRQRWLRDAQSQACARPKVQFLGQGHGVVQYTQFHGNYKLSIDKDLMILDSE